MQFFLPESDVFANSLLWFVTGENDTPLGACLAPSHENTPVRSLSWLLLLLLLLASSVNVLCGLFGASAITNMPLASYSQTRGVDVGV